MLSGRVVLIKYVELNIIDECDWNAYGSGMNNAPKARGIQSSGVQLA